MKRKLLFTLIIITGLLLGVFSTASAEAPQEVGGDWCVIWLPDPTTGIWYDFPGEGQLVFNPQAYVWNLTCKGVFDYEQYATWEEFCNWIPGACRGDRMVANRIEYFHDYFDDQGNWIWTDVGSANLIVKENGEARWNAKISYTCWSLYILQQVTLELPPGFWQAGEHNYNIEYFYDDGWSASMSINFTVDPTAPIYPGQVRMGLNGLTNFFTQVDSINPAQDTFLQVSSWAPKYFYVPLDYAIFTIDEDPPVTVDAGPAHNLCTQQHQGFYMRSWGPKY